MSAVTPPRADLRGGSQSEDSFEISRRIFTQSVILCPFAESRRAANELIARKVPLDPLTSAWIRVAPRGSRIFQTPLSKHGFVAGSFGYSWWRSGVSFSESSSTTAMRPDGTATMLSELAPSYYIIKFILARVLSDTSM